MTSVPGGTNLNSVEVKGRSAPASWDLGVLGTQEVLVPRPGIEPGLEVPETSVMSFSLPGRGGRTADAESISAARR